MRRTIGLVVDLLLVALATNFAIIIRDNLDVSTERLLAAAPYTLFSVGVAAAALLTLGTYRALWRFSTLNDYLRIVAATVIIVAGASLCSFAFNRLEAIPRSLPLLQGMMIAMFMIGGRVVRRLHHSARLKGAVTQPSPRMPLVSGGASTVLVVGLTRLTDLYIRSIGEFAPRSIRVAGLLGQKEKFVGASVHQHQVLGVPEDVARIVRNLEVHGVFVDSIVVAKRFDTLSPKAQQALLQLEASTNIRLVFLTEALGFDTSARPEAVQPAEDSHAAFAYSEEAIEALHSRPYWRIKRMLDIAFASALLILAAPVMLIVAALVAIDVGAPITFWQQRPGQGGRPIRLYKFRTMGAAHDSKGKRIPDNKRLSLIGSFMRRTRLDELPQLFSIITGEMSFVGPRPLLPVDQAPEYSARLLVSPGLTGWAQINGGREIPAADKAALDVWYVQNASLALDLRIILRTVPMVVFGERMSPRDIQKAWRELQDAGICAPQRVTALRSVAEDGTVRAA